MLLTGECQHAEFAGALAEMKMSGDVVEYPCPTAAVDWLKRSQTPLDLIVVAQARPGEVSSAAIEALRGAAPLAPVVALLGSWCEGEMRSGAPWPGVTRVYWHQWPGRFSQEVARLARGELSAWNQPLTSTAEERLLASANPHTENAGSVIAIVSDHYEMADWLAAASRPSNLSAVIFRQLPAGRVAGIDVVVWDAGLPTPGLLDDFGRLVACFAGAPRLVLLDFPRLEDVERLTNAGGAAVLAKPVSVTDFSWNVHKSLRSRR